MLTVGGPWLPPCPVRLWSGSLHGGVLAVHHRVLFGGGRVESMFSWWGTERGWNECPWDKAGSPGWLPMALEGAR